MSVLQITAYLPDKGEVNLLASPTLEAASRRFAEGDAAAGRAAGLEVGGAIEAPWAGRLGGVKTTDGANVMAMWRGRGLIVPGDRADEAGTVSDGGLLLTRPSDSVSSKVMPDGGNAAGGVFRRELRRTLDVAYRGDDDDAFEQPGVRDQSGGEEYGQRAGASGDRLAAAVLGGERRSRAGYVADAEVVAGGVGSAHGDADGQSAAGDAGRSTTLLLGAGSRWGSGAWTRALWI